MRWSIGSLLLILLLLPTGCRSLETERPIPLRGAHSPQRLLFEVDWIDGVRVDPLLFARFAERVSDLFGEDREVVVRLDQAIPNAEARPYWEAEDLVDLELRHRSPDATFWILLSRGLLAEFPDRVGGAWSCSAFALFPDAQPYIYPDQVLIHELGHCLGLVNHRLKMQSPHEDPENPGHCKNRCIMRPQVGYPLFCEDCLEDLEAGQFK